MDILKEIVSIINREGSDEFKFDNFEFKDITEDKIFALVLYMSVYIKDYNNSTSIEELDSKLYKIRNNIVHFYDKYDIDFVRYMLREILGIILKEF